VKDYVQYEDLNETTSHSEVGLKVSPDLPHTANIQYQLQHSLQYQSLTANIPHKTDSISTHP
jgi:hypothetical protein